MRKITTLILFFVTAFAGSISLYAQPKRPPLPDWIFEKPERSNPTFYYHVEKGAGETETEARNAAYTQAFMQVALKLGIPLNTEDISDAIASGTNVKMLSQRFTIPMNVVCFCARQNIETGGWNYWLLCQIPEMGYADNARFDDFNECFKHERHDARMKEKEQAAETRRQDSLRIVWDRNAKALVASTFIPGMGQMIKKQGGKGAAFLLSEVVLFGGGTACYFLGQNKLKTMQATGTSYQDYVAAKNSKNTLDIVMYTCYGIGAAVHITNMVHAWCVKDLNQPVQFAFMPALIPINEYTNTSYIMGAGVQIKF